MKMKKLLAVLLSLAMIMAFTACGGGSSSGGDSEEASGDAPVELHFSNTLAVTNAWNRAAEVLKADLAEKSGGTIDLVIDCGGVNGSDKEQAESCARGDIAICIGSTVGLDNFVTDIGWINLPYVCNNMDDAEKYIFSEDGWMHQMLVEEIEGNGNGELKVLGITSNDFRWLSNSRAPITDPAQLKGMKLRVPESPMYQTFFGELGAIPTAIPFVDLASALQQGTVDGQDNGPQISVPNDLHSFQKYWTKTNHAYAPAIVYMNAGIYDGMSDNQKAVFDECMDTYLQNVRDYVASDYEQFEQTMTDAGCEVIDATDELKKAFEDAAHVTWQTEDCTKTFNQDAVKKILEENGLA